MGRKEKMKDKKGQLNVLISSPIILTIVGGVVGYIIAGNINQDRIFGMVIGGVIGLILSRKIRF